MDEVMLLNSLYMKMSIVRLANVCAVHTKINRRQNRWKKNIKKKNIQMKMATLNLIIQFSEFCLLKLIIYSQWFRSSLHRTRTKKLIIFSSFNATLTFFVIFLFPIVLLALKRYQLFARRAERVKQKRIRRKKIKINKWNAHFIREVIRSYLLCLHNIFSLL